MHLKHIPMDGPQNLRDLGGFLTESGEAVVWNKLYRADGLASLSKRDMETFRKLNIRSIVDLRSDSERKAMPDRILDGVSYHSLHCGLYFQY